MGRPFVRPGSARAGENKGDRREPKDHALGRSRGGFGTKIHILCDAEGNPLHFQLSPGQTHDSQMLDAVLEGADEALRDDDDVQLVWPMKLAGDKGYRAAWIDQYLLDLGMTPVIPSKDNENRNARPVAFDKDAYRRRSIVECLIGWLKESRRVATRFEKTAINFAGMVKLAFIHRYFRICAL
jgi:transposase